MASNDPFRTIRPRAVRVVIPILVVITLVGGIAIILALVSYQGDYSTHIAAIVLVMVLVIAFYLRVLAIRAVPTKEGLRVYNIVLRHNLPWARIVSLHFGDRPWLQLDISDGTVLSVMAIQRADGAYGRQEASRLAALVTAYEGEGGNSGNRPGQE